jgi:hypothetical protein
MKPIIFLFSILILAVAPLRSAAQVTLYPPLNLQAEGIECNVYLTWDKPELPGGGTPAGLLGYNLYKEGSLLAYVSGQDTTWFYDLDPQPCPSNVHTYWVTAYYDLASYGYPGQFGESSSTDTVSIEVICSCCLPLHESWDQASFSYNDWRFSPAQSNWSISNQQGNPPPTAVFTGAPVIQNYAVTLTSKYLPTYVLTGCTNLFLEFDLKLDNVTASGTEMMTVILEHCGEPVDTLLAVDNTAGFDWTHYRMLINDGRGGSSRILFTASGQNSSNIQQWLVDNIIVDFKCKPPLNLTGTHVGNIVTLLWDPPLCDCGTSFDSVFSGYNVYMSDSLGMAPFHRITAAPCADDSIVINLAPGWDPEVVRFYVTDLQNELVTHTFLCESEPSDTVIAYFVGIDPKKNSTCNIYPNPNKGMFTADLPADALSLEISDMEGRVLYSEDLMSHPGKQVDFDISGQPKGIYILTVRTKTVISRGKIVLY